MADLKMVKLPVNLSVVVIVLLSLGLYVEKVSALPIADAEAEPSPVAKAEAEPKPKADIIPGRIQNNPVLLIYDLLANLIASIPIFGIPLVSILGLGRRR